MPALFVVAGLALNLGTSHAGYPASTATNS